MAAQFGLPCADISAPQLTSAHFFTGGCGDLLGFTGQGFLPVYAGNHNPFAVETARLNWRGLFVQDDDIQNVDMRSVPSAHVVVAAPICTEASPAGGNAAPKDLVVLDKNNRPQPGGSWPQTRITMWEPVRYAEVHRPLAYVGENVPAFGNSQLFEAWLHVWRALGYTPVIASVNAAHLKVERMDLLPQSRDRLSFCFVRNDVVAKCGLPDLTPTCAAMCPTCGPVEGVQYWAEPDLLVGQYRTRPGKPRKRKKPKDPTKRKLREYCYVCPDSRCGARVEPITRGVGDIIDPTVRGERFGLGYFEGKQRVKRTAYVQATRDRVARGLELFNGKPFIVTLRKHCSATSLDEPIGTVTAQGHHHYLARPTADLTIDSCEYRRLTNREKARAQGFPDSHEFAGEPNAQQLQIGNAVPVTVAAWQAAALKKVLTAWLALAA